LFYLSGQLFSLNQDLIADLEAVRDRRIVPQVALVETPKSDAQIRASLEHLMQLAGNRREIASVAGELQSVGLSALGFRQAGDAEADLSTRVLAAKFGLSSPCARARHNRKDSER